MAYQVLRRLSFGLSMALLVLSTLAGLGIAVFSVQDYLAWRQYGWEGGWFAFMLLLLAAVLVLPGAIGVAASLGDDTHRPRVRAGLVVLAKLLSLAWLALGVWALAMMLRRPLWPPTSDRLFELSPLIGLMGAPLILWLPLRGWSRRRRAAAAAVIAAGVPATGLFAIYAAGAPLWLVPACSALLITALAFLVVIYAPVARGHTAPA
jgi:succinate dehydrogenase hydrophobic anchor subunit